MLGVIVMQTFNYIGLIVVALLLIPNLMYYLKHKEEVVSKNGIFKTLAIIGISGSLFFMVINIPYTWLQFYFMFARGMYFISNVTLAIIYVFIFLVTWDKKSVVRAILLTIIPFCIFTFSAIMLGCLDEKITAVNPDSKLSLFGQEYNPETYAIAKADMLIKGGNAQNMKFGNTLNDDQFSGYEFDYIISNPPFGIDWKSEAKDVKKEHEKLGFSGRFGPGLPAISDSQMLFMLNGVKKLKEGSGRMAIIQNGSSLFTGDAGSGPSEIRRYIIENDMLEAIIQLPTDLFYNTSITTYIWLITKGKSSERIGKVHLIDAKNCFVKRRRNIGKKRVDLDDNAIELILKAYNEFVNGEYQEDERIVESKIFYNNFLGYRKVVVETPKYHDNGQIVFKKGKPVSDKELKDTEIIPLLDDVETFFKKNVLPYKPDSWLDRKQDKTGYEIPFTRIFYKFSPPKDSNEILEELHELEELEKQLLRELSDNV